MYMRRWFLNFFASSMSRNVLLKFLLASLKMLTNSRYFTRKPHQNPPPPPFPPNETGAAGGNSKGIGSLKSTFEVPTINHPFSQLVSVFIKASQNFIFYFLHNKAAKKFKNYRRIYRKYWFNLLRPSKKLFISWHNPFKKSTFRTVKHTGVQML